MKRRPYFITSNKLIEVMEIGKHYFTSDLVRMTGESAARIADTIKWMKSRKLIRGDRFKGPTYRWILIDQRNMSNSANYSVAAPRTRIESAAVLKGYDATLKERAALSLAARGR